MIDLLIILIALGAVFLTPVLLGEALDRWNKYRNANTN